jgi:hypothetical protein
LKKRIVITPVKDTPLQTAFNAYITGLSVSQEKRIYTKETVIMQGLDNGISGFG